MRMTLTIQIFVLILGTSGVAQNQSELLAKKAPSSRVKLRLIEKEDTSKEDARLFKLYRDYNSRNAQSCESQYYGLFTNGFQRKDSYWGDGINRDESFHFHDFAWDQKTENSLRDEAEQELRTAIVPLLTQSLQDDPYFSRLKGLVNSLKHQMENTSVIIRDEGNAADMDKGETHNELGIGLNKLLRLPSPSVKAFYMGHELGHLNDNEVPHELEACLSNSKSIGARIAKPVEQAFEEREDSFAGGRGTQYINPMDLLVRSGDYEDASQELRRLAWGGLLPTQIDEAKSDYMGTLAAVAYIKTHYKTREERKRAALAVLFSFPPHLYEPEGQVIMDQIGSKKTNETRVFRGILANEEFRGLIGCSFDDVFDQPLDCSKPTFSQALRNHWGKIQDQVSKSSR
jgi:hypothetical protein